MPVERSVLDPDTRRARSIVRITFRRADGEEFGPDELTKMAEIPTTSGVSALDQQMALIAEYMRARGWPAQLGRCWANSDGTRWELAENAPDWAARLILHPAQLYPERSPERDAFEILLLCENVRGMIQAKATATSLVGRAIELGMLLGRNKFEAQFGRACDVGIGRILSGGKGGRAYADTKEFERELRLGALQRAIVASPTAGPSAWARTVKELWPDSDDPEGAARKFYGRHKEELGHEILMS